jgi:uncharacterized membrane protein
MSTFDRATLWARLRDAALVEGDVPPAKAPQAPWFVRAMLGIAGWIGAIFLLGFVGAFMAALIESPTASLVVGAIVCAGAVLLFRWGRNNDFLDQFAFATSLAGQALILAGLFLSLEKQSGDPMDEIALVAILMAGIQAILFFLAPDFLHRVWTAWTGGVALMVALASWRLYPYAPALLLVALLWIWLREIELPRQGARLRPGGYGLTLAAMLAVLLRNLIESPFWTNEETARAQALHLWLGAAAGGAALVWAVFRLIRREGVPVDSAPGRIALAGAVILAVASLWAPGLAPMIAILVVGYANGNRVLTGLGILGLLGYLSYYYYSLEMTLLQKSALMVGVGAALLLARLALHRWWPEEAAHA